MSAEAAALHAVMDNDESEARRILEDFYAAELKDLICQADRLSALCKEILKEKHR